MPHATRLACASEKATGRRTVLLFFAFSVLLLLALLESAAGQSFTASANLLTNPGCEDANEGGGSDNGNAPIGWIQSTHSFPRGNTLNCHAFVGNGYGPHNGSTMYFLADDLQDSMKGSYVVSISQTKPIPDGATEIRASGWFLRLATTGNANGALRLSILSGPFGGTLATVRLPPSGWLQDNVGTSYGQKTIRLTVPAGGTHAQLIIIHSNNHPLNLDWGADVWDDMELIALTPVTTGMIATTGGTATAATITTTTTTTTTALTGASSAVASSSTTASSTSSSMISTSSFVTATTTMTSAAPTAFVSVGVADNSSTSPAFPLWAIISTATAGCLLVIFALLVVRRVAASERPVDRDSAAAVSELVPAVASSGADSDESSLTVFDSVDAYVDEGALSDSSSSMEIVYASLNSFN